VFLTVMVIGLVGLVMMALPALGGHPVSHVSMHGHGPGPGSGTAFGHPVGGHPVGGHNGGGAVVRAHGAALPALGTSTRRRVIPSPRAVFSVLALYGAFGNALVHAAHLTGGSAALLALGPALLVEGVLIRPVWNLLFRFRAEATPPLEELIFCEAEAVVQFRNGKGVVAMIRDGRRIQLSARLWDRDAGAPVAFGQRLRIEDVDARRERVTVSLLPKDEVSSEPT
jgi:hypothetical protein